MNKKKLLLFAFLAGMTAPLAQAETESAPAPSFEPALTRPAPPPFQPLLDCTSGYDIGDVDFNGEVEYDDLIKLLNCVFVNPASSGCLPCVADINCDTFYSPSDLVILFRFFFGVYSEFPTLKLSCPN